MEKKWQGKDLQDQLLKIIQIDLIVEEMFRARLKFVKIANPFGAKIRISLDN